MFYLFLPSERKDSLEFKLAYRVQLHSQEQINPGTIWSERHIFLSAQAPSTTHPCLPGQPVNHRPALSHGARKRRGRGGVSGKGDEAGWLAEVVWNYCRPTSARWKYHQNLLGLGMHEWIPATPWQKNFLAISCIHLCVSKKCEVELK